MILSILDDNILLPAFDAIIKFVLVGYYIYLTKLTLHHTKMELAIQGTDKLCVPWILNVVPQASIFLGFLIISLFIHQTNNLCMNKGIIKRFIL